MELGNVRGWPVLYIDGDAVTQAGSGWGVALQVNDQGFPGAGTAEVVVNTPEERILRYARSQGVLEERFRRFPALGDHAWLRSLHYTNISDAVQDITRCDMRVWPNSREDGARWVSDWFWMEETPRGSVAMAYRGTTDMYFIEQTTQGLQHRVDAAWRLQPGQEALIEEQGFWWFDGDADDFRAQAQVWYAAIWLELPIEYPRWVREATLYEVSAGGHIFSKFSDVGGFDNFQVQPPYLAEMGINTFWLNSVHQHKSAEGGWNFYGPLDFDVIDPAYGGAEGLHTLMEVIDDAGIRVIGGIVPHGHLSKQALALPEWWTVTREGELQRNWGGAGMDYSSPEWQEVMGRATGRLATEFGMQGVRIDVAGGSGSNWASSRTNHASYSNLAGSVELLEVIIDAMGEGVEHPIMIPEVTREFPEHYALGAVGYGFPLVFLMQHLEESQRGDAVGWRNRLRSFFERERGSLPEGALVIRSINNHDTVNDSGRTIQRFGVGKSRALFGVCLAVPGIPMMYQEEEIGSYEAFQQMFHARKHIPEFIDGDVDYLSIDFAPEVFAVLRPGDGDSHALGLINLGCERIDGVVTLPEGLPLGAAQAWDGVSGEIAEIVDGAFDWSLAPYQVALMRLGAAPEAPALEAPEASGAAQDLVWDAGSATLRMGDLMLALYPDGDPGNWNHGSNPDGTQILIDGRRSIRVKPVDGAYEVQIRAENPGEHVEIAVRHADRWMVNGRTALMADRNLRRHYPWPEGSGYNWDRSVIWGPIPNWKIYDRVAPSGRIWESLFEELHPEAPGLAFLREDGQGLALTGLTTNAQRQVLTNRSDEAVVEPYGLHLRLYQRDPDLAQSVNLFGLHQPWRLLETVALDAEDSEPIELRFRVAAGDRNSIVDRFEVERLESALGSARMHFSNEEIVQGIGNYYWLREGGSVRWENLSAVPNGPYRIRMTLRHSERAGDQFELRPTYHVFVNGEEMPLEWEDNVVFESGNAYFSHAYTPPLDLSQGLNLVEVRSDKTWTAVDNVLYLLPDPDATIPEARRHSADRDRNGRIQLGDLLEVVQYYNSGGYHCVLADYPDATASVYAPGVGNRDCAPHDSDYAPQDWEINIREVLRLVQFYHANNIIAVGDIDPPTEDGFRPVF